MNIVRNFVLSGFCLGLSTLPSFASDSTGAAVSDTMTIKAPVKYVWEAMRAIRKNDPAHKKILQSGGGDYVVEEKFDGLPIIGQVTCTYKEHEVPMKRLEYQMISSDKFKAFEGAWNLTPSADGKETTVQLSSRTDTGIHIPFAGSITRKNALKTVDKRLDSVKAIAEASSLRVASTTHGVSQ